MPRMLHIKCSILAILFSLPLVIAGCGISPIPDEHLLISRVTDVMKTAYTYTLKESITYSLTMGDVPKDNDISQMSIYQRQFNSNMVIDLRKKESQISVEEHDVSAPEMTQVSFDRYVVDGWEYSQTIHPAADLVKHKLNDQLDSFINNQDQIPPMITMLQNELSVDLVGTEKIGDADCFILAIVPARESIVNWLLAQQLSVTVQGRGSTIDDAKIYYLTTYQNSSVKIWVDKTKYSIIQVTVNARFMNQKDEDFQGLMNFSNYDEQVVIHLPSQLLGAQEP